MADVDWEAVLRQKFLQDQIAEMKNTSRSLENGGLLIAPRILIALEDLALYKTECHTIFDCYGSTIHNLRFKYDNIFSGAQLIGENQSSAVDALNKCPNIETLQLVVQLRKKEKDLMTYNPFFINEHPRLFKLHLSINEDYFGKASKNFESNLHDGQKAQFYLDLFKNIIMSTEQLKCLCIDDGSSFIDIYQMLAKPDVAGKLGCIQHLILSKYYDYDKQGIKAIETVKLLEIVSNSVETLTFGDVEASRFCLPLYPKLPRLKSLFIEADPDYIHSMKLISDLLPSLETLVIGEYKRDKERDFCPDDHWRFQWPFCVTLGGWTSRFQWQESMKDLAVGNGPGGAWGTSKPQLNVVIYLSKEAWEYEDESPDEGLGTDWVDTIFKEISKMNVGSIFVNLQHTQPDEYTESLLRWKKLLLPKLDYITHLKHCVIHDGRKVGQLPIHPPKTYQFIRRKDCKWDFVQMP